MKRLITKSAAKILAATGMIVSLVFIAAQHNDNKRYSASKSERQLLAKMQWFFVRTAPTIVVNSEQKADSILQERGHLWLAANENEWNE